MTNYEEWKAERLKDPEVRREYEKLKVMGILRTIWVGFMLLVIAIGFFACIILFRSCWFG